MAPSFGLVPPEAGSRASWPWLRLKGGRDISSGVLVLSFMALDGHRLLGIVLLILTINPLSDMSVVLSNKGRVATALAVHGLTALALLVAAIPLIIRPQ